MYYVCMARINVYVPDDLAARSREAGLNVSALTQEALAAALAAGRTDVWLDSLGRGRGTPVSTRDVLAAVDDVRDDFGVID